jgi:predicted PurR-regulated permease PerM
MDDVSPGRPPRRRVEITVSFRTLAFVLAVVALAFALASIGDALLLLFVALFLSLVLDPLVTGLARKLRAPRGVAATVVVLGVVALVGLLVATVAVPLIDAVRDLVRDLPNIVSSIRRSELFRSLDRRFDLGAELQRRAGDLAGRVPSAAVDVVGIGGAVATALFETFAAVFLTLYLLIDLPRLESALHSVLRPETSTRVAARRAQITTTVTRYALGAIVIAIVAASVEGTSAWLLGAPFPLALAVLAGLLDLVPQVGATIGGAILVLATLTQGLLPALVMLAVVVAYQQLENYALQPAIQGRAADVSGFFVVGSVVVGAALLGVLGALVAVPLTAAIQIVVRELTADRRARMAALRADAAGAGGAPATPPAPGSPSGRRP